MLAVNRDFTLALADNFKEKLAKEAHTEIDFRVMKTWLLFLYDYVEELELEHYERERTQSDEDDPVRRGEALACCPARLESSRFAASRNRDCKPAKSCARSVGLKAKRGHTQ